MRRPRGQGLLGGATGLAIVLLVVGACGGSSGDAVPAPDPTVEIADAPTTTPAPTAPSAPAEEPTVTPAPAATPEPTTAPELTVEEQVIAAWERYWDLAVEARGENPSAEALAFSSYASGEQLSALENVVARQKAEGYFLMGSVTVGAVELDVREPTVAVVDDCVHVNFRRVSLADGSELSAQDEMRSARGRIELVDGSWLVLAVETGSRC